MLGSLVSSKARPWGKLPVPETWAKLVPPSVLRKIPMLPKVKASAMLTETTIVLPRGATPEMFLPARPPLITVQSAPPFVVFSRPRRAPPTEAKLLKRPTPATSVLKVPSVGSKAIPRPMESEPRASVCETQFGLAAVPLVVFQTPPFTAPT